MSRTGRDWVSWHADYDVEGSRLQRRLQVVQSFVAAALDAAPPGPVRVLSMCAGQARDLTGVLATHERGRDVVGRLVELDPDNAAHARRSLGDLGVTAVEVVEGDAGVLSAYDGAAPADVVLACGIFGNVADTDVSRTVALLPRLCADGATVVWTRHRAEPDLTPSIRRWFAEAGFEEVAFEGPAGESFGVGAHRFLGRPAPARLFAFDR